MACARRSNMQVEDALELYLQLDLEDENRERNEGSDSCEEDVTYQYRRRSGPSEPAILDSVFVEDEPDEPEVRMKTLHRARPSNFSK